MQNWSITQDRNGFIYAGNGNGVLEYDGESWRLIPLDDLNAVRSIAIDENNVKWVGGDRELGYLEPDSLGFLRYISLKNKIPPSHALTANVWNVFTTNVGVVFRGGDTIYIWRNGVFQIIPNKGRIHTGFQVGERIFFRLYEKGLYELQDGKLNLIPQGEVFKDIRVYAALPFKDNSILLGTRDAGLFVYDGTSVSKFENEIDDYLISNRLYNGLHLPDTTYAFTTLRGGLIIIGENGKIRRTITTKNGLLNDEIYGICLDDRNGIWLGLQTGISHIEHLRPYTFFGKKMGLGGTVDAFARHKGKLYVGTYDGIHSWEHSSTENGYRFKRIDEINSGCTSLLSTNDCLLALTDDGTFEIRNGAIEKLNNLKGVFSYRSQIDTNRIFIGHKEGLATLYFFEGAWQNESTIGQIDEEAISMTETGTNTLWLGTRVDGVVKIEFPSMRGEKWKRNPENLKIYHYNQKHGLPHGWNKVYTIDGQLRVTANTEMGPPLFKFDATADSFIPDTEFGKKFGLDSVMVHPLAVQDNGTYMLLKSLSIAGWPSRFSSYKNAQTGKYRVTKLQDWRFSGHYKVFWENQNLFWLGSEDVVRYEIPKNPENVPPFKTFIRKVISGQDSIIYGGVQVAFNNPKLKHSHRGLRFQFAAPIFDDSQSKTYQYFLKGFDKEWSNWSHETQKDYTNIYEGDYQFLVRAKDVHGEVSEPAFFLFQYCPLGIALCGPI